MTVELEAVKVCSDSGGGESRCFYSGDGALAVDLGQWKCVVTVELEPVERCREHDDEGSRGGGSIGMYMYSGAGVNRGVH